ncbi:polycystin-1-like protein 2 [Ptychodera flava]|uniref:polycystin-1-like protein 2 n=1 Tax=Ptychodera flava TaxID=63121 RepID=UPI003969D1BB
MQGFTAVITDYFDELSNAITGLSSVVVSSKESQSIAQDILQVMDRSISTEVYSTPASETSDRDSNWISVTNSLLSVADKLSKFVLSNTEPGTGPIELATHSILLNLECDSVDRLTNTSVELGNGNGLELPAAVKLFANDTSIHEVNRICQRLKGSLFQPRTNGRSHATTDVLSLTFTDRDGNELKVNHTGEAILITLATDPPQLEDQIKIEGDYLEVDDVTYFGFNIKISTLFHAVIVWFENSYAIYGNATAYVFSEVVSYTDDYRRYQFSIHVNFFGEFSTIFIPEHYFLRTGHYYLTFTIPKNVDIKFLMSVKQARCAFLKEDIGIWDDEGCQVSKDSNITHTVCLCNHLSTFTITN